MEKKDLIYYLTDLSRVQDLKQEELEAWLAQYPYSQNLHLLKAKKQYLQEGAFSEGDVIYATQRSHFFRQVEEQTWDTFEVEKEMPVQAQRYATKIPLMTGEEDHAIPEEMAEETSDTTTGSLENNLVSVEELPAEIPVEVPETDTAPQMQGSDPTLIPAIIKTMLSSGEIPVGPKPEITPESPVIPAVPVEANASKTPVSAEKPVPSSKEKQVSRTIPTVPNGNGISPFTKWLHDLRRPFEEPSIPLEEDEEIDLDIPLTAPQQETTEGAISTGNNQIPVTSKSEEKEPALTPEAEPNLSPEQVTSGSSEQDTKNPYVELAKSSNEVKDHIGSETLAKLLYNQGFRDLAIQMYERLALKSPEKSSYFADQIRIIRENL